jgi:hypothetical protein
MLDRHPGKHRPAFALQRTQVVEVSFPANV